MQMFFFPRNEKNFTQCTFFCFRLTFSTRFVQVCESEPSRVHAETGSKQKSLKMWLKKRKRNEWREVKAVLFFCFLMQVKVVSQFVCWPFLNFFCSFLKKCFVFVEVRSVFQLCVFDASIKLQRVQEGSDLRVFMSAASVLETFTSAEKLLKN